MRRQLELRHQPFFLVIKGRQQALRRAQSAIAHGQKKEKGRGIEREIQQRRQKAVSEGESAPCIGADESGSRQKHREQKGREKAISSAREIGRGGCKGNVGSRRQVQMGQTGQASWTLSRRARRAYCYPDDPLLEGI
ncbi:hypothetical protein ACLOJK_019613 [Asimina triloba]